MLVEIKKTFPVSHPTGAGHFPGNPIIPGALLLAEVMRTIEQNSELSLAASTLKSAKFAAPARPGDCVNITFETVDKQIKFHCMVEEITVLTGSVRCDIPTTV